MSVFRGSAVALITPMKDNEDINFDKLRELVEFHIEKGTDAIVVCGTTGEPSTLDIPEHIEAIEAAVDAAKKRIPIIAGCGSNNTRTSEFTSKESQRVGADALLMVTPYYNKTTQEGLKRHFIRLAKGVDLPIILYNVPGRTGLNMLPETAFFLGKTCENIVALKEASGDISQVAKLSALLKEEPVMDLYSGNDDQIAPVMSLGGAGVISVFANICPFETHEMTMAYLNGDTEKCKDMQLDALELINALFLEVNPILIKTAMNLLGYEVGPLRSPLYPPSETNLNKLKEAIKNYGLQIKA